LKHECRLTLNARKMTMREEAHAHMMARLRLPEWYGKNLDALNDCLGEINAPTRIVVRFAPMLKESLGEYGTKLLDVLEHAVEENPNLQITLREHF
jgi:ribonuclease inhibitor